MDREAADIDGRQEEKWRAKRIKSGTKGKGERVKEGKTAARKKKVTIASWSEWRHGWRRAVVRVEELRQRRA